MHGGEKDYFFGIALVLGDNIGKGAIVVLLWHGPPPADQDPELLRKGEQWMAEIMDLVRMVLPMVQGF